MCKDSVPDIVLVPVDVDEIAPSLGTVTMLSSVLLWEYAKGREHSEWSSVLELGSAERDRKPKLTK